MGNKGGVGISLNIDGTTMLLINAHLTGGFLFVVLKLILRRDVSQLMKEKSHIA